MPAAPASFLDPALLARISDLALLARTVVDGFMHGQHRSMRSAILDSSGVGNHLTNAIETLRA